MRIEQCCVLAAAILAPLLAGFQQTPTANDDFVARNEGAPPTTINVLANDMAPAGQSMSVFGFTQPQFGVVTRTGSALLYTPTAVASRLSLRDAFTYTVETSTGLSDSAVVYVDLVNLPPTAVNDLIPMARNQSVTFDPRVNDIDPGGDPIVISSVSAPSVGQMSFAPYSVNYRPPVGFAGPVSFGYTIADDEGATSSATITVAVSSANTPPIAFGYNAGHIGWGQTVTIPAGNLGSDADGDPITVTAVGPLAPNVGSHGSTNGGAGVYYTAPRAPFLGNVIFTYTISDGQGGTATATIYFSVDSGA